MSDRKYFQAKISNLKLLHLLTIPDKEHTLHIPVTNEGGVMFLLYASHVYFNGKREGVKKKQKVTDVITAWKRNSRCI